MKDDIMKWVPFLFAGLVGVLGFFLGKGKAPPPDEDEINDLGNSAAHHEGSSEAYESHANDAHGEAVEENVSADELKEEADSVHAAIEEHKDEEESNTSPPINTDDMTPEEVDDAFKEDGF